jgi:hypothetical protein
MVRVECPMVNTVSFWSGADCDASLEVGPLAVARLVVRGLGFNLLEEFTDATIRQAGALFDTICGRT